jgi:hypothetical protein
MKTIVLTMCALLSCSQMEAKKKEKHRDYAEFRDGDRVIIYEYYRGRKHEQLPPGLAKQLRKNGRLPPGLAKKMQPLPVELDRRLPPLPPGCSRALIDDRAVIYDTRSMNILDITLIIR